MEKLYCLKRQLRESGALNITVEAVMCAWAYMCYASVPSVSNTFSLSTINGALDT